MPRLNNEGLRMRPNTFWYFFGVDYDDIEAEFFRARLVQPANPSRIPNKARHTARHHEWDNDNIQKGFSMATQGVSLSSPAHDSGSDMSDGEEDGSQA